MIKKIKKVACMVVGGFILIGGAVGLVLYCLLGGVLCLGIREER